MAINISAETLGLPLQDSTTLGTYFAFFIEKLKKLAHIAYVVISFGTPV